MYLFELTPPHFLNGGDCVKVRTIRGRKIQEVVLDPGLDVVHEILRIDKGRCGKAVDSKPRSRAA
jgi:hypothetical protein